MILYNQGRQVLTERHARIAVALNVAEPTLLSPQIECSLYSGHRHNNQPHNHDYDHRV